MPPKKRRTAATNNVHAPEPQQQQANTASVPDADSRDVSQEPERGTTSITEDRLKALMKEAFKAGLQEARNQTGTISTGGIAANAQSGSAMPQDVGPPLMTSNTPATSNHSASAVTVEDSVGGLDSIILPANQLASMTTTSDELTSFSAGAQITTPLVDLVDPKIKQNILMGKFVDMSSITEKNTDSLQMVLSTDDSGNTNIQWVHKDTTNKPLTIEEWTTKFSIYIAVFCLNDQAAYPQLLKYQSMIRNLASKPADWQFYDTNFRRLRANANYSLRWDMLHLELWNEALSRRPTSGSSTNKPGICHKFARGEYCGGCRYSHKCGICNAKHPVTQCPVMAHSRPHIQTPPRFRQTFRPRQNTSNQPRFFPRGSGFGPQRPRHYYPY
ncbi:uncharacterized protein [Argopecten irradians]|uniref:uncharacterized protein n=1 Tax=Argopecten irradians TaxID=31199 RepID=UPI00371869A4